MDADLPPSNVNAMGLHLTDREYAGVMAFVRAQAMIGKAWIYGSRHTGHRRSKEGHSPPDIDLAVELTNVPDGQFALAMMNIRFAASEFFMHAHPQFGLTSAVGQVGFVQIEFPGLEGGQVSAFISATGATLIFAQE
jgi:hypothetical protein